MLLFANFCIALLYKFHNKKLECNVSAAKRLPVEILISLKASIIFSIYIFGIIYFFEFIHIGYIDNFLYTIKRLYFITILTFASIQIIRTIENHYLTSKASSLVSLGSHLNIIGTIAKMVVIFISFVAILGIFGIDTNAILTISGVGGIAFGIAGKDLFANFFGFLVIALDRPFKVGDIIDSPDKQIKGVVKKVNWRMTEVLTYDKMPIYIPNSLFTTMTIQNRTRMFARRIKEKIRFYYNKQELIEEFITQIKDFLKNDTKNIHQEFGYTLEIIKISRNIVDIEFICFTNTKSLPKYIQVKNYVLLKIDQIAKDYNLASLTQAENISIYDQIENYQNKKDIDISKTTGKS